MKKLKDYFIPHEDNDHAPHFLRPKAVLFAVGIILVAEGFFLANKIVLPQTNLLALIFPDVIVVETNESRISNEVSPLRANPILEQAAALKAKDMVEKGYFAHTSPEGLTPWHWFEEAGYSYAYAGENLAVNFLDSEDVTRAWLDSPTHRANILNGRFTEIGIAAAKGIYRGQETTFVVQMFGRPKAIAVAPVPTPVPPPTPVAEPPAKIQPEPLVAGESDAVIPAADETFVAVSGAEAALEPENILPEVAPAPFQPTAAIRRAVASPRTTTNFVFEALALIFMAALALKILVKIKIQRPRLILNGFLVLALLAGVVFVNQHLALSSAVVL